MSIKGPISQPILENQIIGNSSTNHIASLDSAVANQNTESHVAADSQQTESQCSVCGKHYHEISNFDGACVYHPEDAMKVNEGTEIEVWSCCMSKDTYKGCLKSRHIPIK